MEALDARARVVTRDAREAGVNDATDAGNRDGGFGDVRGKDDALPRGDGLKRALLLAGGKGGEERDDFGVRTALVGEVLGGLADVALAGEEDQHVAVGREFVERVGDEAREVRVVLVGRAPQRLDGMQAAGDADDGRVVEKL